MADFVDPSVTAAIVAAKDKLVVESSRAEVIVDQWYATGNLVQDAPSDGLAYNRKDAGWVEAASGGGGGSGDMLKATYDPTNIGADAFARSNHTGSQAIATVVGLQTALDATIEEAPIDSKTYGRKNETWAEVVAGTSKNDVYTASVVSSSIPETILQWRNIAAGKYKFTWNTYANYSAWNGFPSITPVSGQITWYVEVQVLPDSHRLITAYNESALGVWTLDTTGKTSGAMANTLYSKKAPSSILDIQDVITTNLASNIGKVLTVIDATRTGFVNAPSGATNLGNTPTAATVALTSSSGTGTTLPAATTSLAGVMTAANNVKLAGIATGAEVNVQSDWNAASGDALILNKPVILPDAPSDTKQYARQDGTWAEVVASGGGGSAKVELYDFPYVAINQITTITSSDWKSGFITAFNSVNPVAADRLNKTYGWQFGGTASPTPFTFPTPDEIGIPLGGSIGIVLSGATFFVDARVSEFSINAASPFNTITGITRINRAAKLFLPINTPAAGSDNTWSTLRLTAYKPKPFASTLAWLITQI